MKKQIELRKVKDRTKAFIDDEPIKTIPIPFIPIVEELGFIDIRTDKKNTISRREGFAYNLS